LNVVPIDIAPLRQRKEDIPDLVNLFISRFAGDSGKPVEGISPEAMQILVNYHWPGNVRELQNIIERACALAKGTVLKVTDIHLDSSGERQRMGRELSAGRDDAGAVGR
jgi:two-component system, NtrC family, response regulator AtoC